jgi:hypothetical protein
MVLMLPLLGDFDSLEYAQALVAAWPQLEAAGITVLAIRIGDEASRQRFCSFTGFPSERLQVDAEPQLHRAPGLYEGLRQIGGPWPNLPPIQGSFFARAGGRGFQRPFELATVLLLSNMSEVLAHWGTYVP